MAQELKWPRAWRVRAWGTPTDGIPEFDKERLEGAGVWLDERDGYDYADVLSLAWRALAYGFEEVTIYMAGVRA